MSKDTETLFNLVTIMFCINFASIVVLALWILDIKRALN